MRSCRQVGNASAGFTLIETIIATSILVTVLSGVLQLMVFGQHVAARSRRRGQALGAAQSKLEELRAMPFGWDSSGAPISDSRLRPSPVNSLRVDVDGFSERLDANAEVLADVASAPGVFARRWFVGAFEDHDPNLLTMEVCVFLEPVRDAGESTADACVWTLRVRQP